MALQRNGLFTLIIFLFAFTGINGLPLESQNAPVHPQQKQGILEIPKQAATIIRNFIDSGLQTYLNLTTPKPNLSQIPELQTSIVGNFLLGGLFSTPGPARPYNPQEAIDVVQPIFTSNEQTYVGHSPLVTSPPQPPQAPPVQEATGRPRTRRTTKTPVHTLDTDASLSGIYNSYGVLLNTPDEVYWVEDYKRPSVIIPIETTARPPPPRPKPSSTTIKSTTEDDDGEEDPEEEAENK